MLRVTTLEFSLGEFLPQIFGHNQGALRLDCSIDDYFFSLVSQQVQIEFLISVHFSKIIGIKIFTAVNLEEVDPTPITPMDCTIEISSNVGNDVAQKTWVSSRFMLRVIDRLFRE
jgi:hypothetical protein